MNTGIKAIIEAISIAINEEFGDDYTIYTERVEQGLKEPCFFVRCIKPTSRVYLGLRYFKTHQMCIQYFPVDKNQQQEECSIVSERLFDCLEYLTADGDLIRGTEMNAELLDGVLHFFVNYDFFVRKVKRQDAMEDLQERVAAKGER